MSRLDASFMSICLRTWLYNSCAFCGLSFTWCIVIPVAAVKYLAPTLCADSSLHRIIHLAPWWANPPGLAIKLAWKDVLPVFGLAPTSIRWPAFTPCTTRVRLGIPKFHLASKSFLDSKASMLMSSHSILRLGVKSSPYCSRILRRGSSVDWEPLT